MPKPTKASLDQAKRDFLGKYINIRYIGTDRETLAIRFDEIVMAFLDSGKFVFSPSKFETLLVKEVNDKILNKPVTTETFNRLCDFIWKLAEYCSNERARDEQQTTRTMEERARRKRADRIGR